MTSFADLRVKWKNALNDAVDKNQSRSSHTVISLCAPHSLLFLQLQAERRLTATNIKLLNRHFDICLHSEASTFFTDCFNDVSFCFLIISVSLFCCLLLLVCYGLKLNSTDLFCVAFMYMWITTCLMSVLLHSTAKDRLLKKVFIHELSLTCAHWKHLIALFKSVATKDTLK